MRVKNVRRLRVLVVDEELPWPPNSGKRVRTWNLLRRLSDRHDLHWIAYGPVSEEAKLTFRQQGISIDVLDPLPPSKGIRFYGRLLASLLSGYPYSVVKHFTSRLQHRILEACELKQFDLVHFEWTPYARCKSSNLPRLIVAHNVESDIWRRRAQNSSRFIGRHFFGIQASRMEAFERKTAENADCIVAVSELDAERFRSYGAPVTIVPNGVDLDYYQPTTETSENQSLLFVGSLDWHPNIDGVTEFVRHVLPLVRSRKPQATLRIIGRRPSSQLAMELQRVEGVNFVGEVADVRPHLAQASAVIVPLRIGGGTRIKILEAMAMAKPVISTSIGVEGLAIQDQCDFLLANTPLEFAARIDSLFADVQLRTRLGRNGRLLVERLYGWDSCADKLEESWLSVAGMCATAAAGPPFAVGAIR